MTATIYGKRWKNLGSLGEPDVYTPKKGDKKVRYTINVRFDKKTEAKVRAKLDELTADMDTGKNDNSPWKEDKKEGKGQDTHTLFAFSGADLENPKKDYKPPVFDAKNRKLPARVVVGGGTKGRIEVTLNPFDGFGGGINLYINAVQVVDLVEKTFGKSNFDEVEDGYDGEGEDRVSSFGSSSDGASDDDETPF